MATLTLSLAYPPISSTPRLHPCAQEVQEAGALHQRRRTLRKRITPEPPHEGAHRKIIATYQFRKEEERYSKRILMERISARNPPAEAAEWGVERGER